MNVTLPSTVRRWALLRCEAPLLAPLDMLRANGCFASAAKFVVPPGGAPALHAEIPPFRGDGAWRERADADLAGVAVPDSPELPATMDHLGADLVDRVFALAGESGFSPDIRPGGDTCIPIGAGREARLRSLAGHPALWVTALHGLPEAGPCREAAVAFALAAPAEIRLVRASLTADERLVWEVPLPDSFPPVLVDHALNALATAARCAAREIEDLAADTTLASAWMRFHKQT